jgi:outer membrane immunogenic protein
MDWLMRVLPVFVTALALSGPAFAQTTNWSGFYGGVVVGSAGARSNARTTTAVTPVVIYFTPADVETVASAGAQQINPPRVLFGGANVGFDRQAGAVVGGVEAVFGAMSLSGSQTATMTFPDNVFPFTITQSVSARWLLTAGPRVGVAKGRFLLYATGGMAITRVNYQATYSDNLLNAHGTESGGVKTNLQGWVVGGGVERRLAKHWSVKGEYLLASFTRGSTTSANLTSYGRSSNPTLFPDNTFTHSADLHARLVRIGVNVRF